MTLELVHGLACRNATPGRRTQRNRFITENAHAGYVLPAFRSRIQRLPPRLEDDIL